MPPNAAALGAPEAPTPNVGGRNLIYDVKKPSSLCNDSEVKGAANLSWFWPFIYLFSAVLAGTFSESPGSFFPRLHTIIKDAGFHTLYPW